MTIGGYRVLVLFTAAPRVDIQLCERNDGTPFLRLARKGELDGPAFEMTRADAIQLHDAMVSAIAAIEKATQSRLEKVLAFAQSLGKCSMEACRGKPHKYGLCESHFLQAELDDESVEAGFVRALMKRETRGAATVEPSSDRDTGFSMPPEDDEASDSTRVVVVKAEASGVYATTTFRDPAVKGEEAWRVQFKGRITSPSFNSQGAAEAYLDALKQGRRQPEYADAG
jgi:hypothetical protein